MQNCSARFEKTAKSTCFIGQAIARQTKVGHLEGDELRKCLARR